MGRRTSFRTSSTSPSALPAVKPTQQSAPVNSVNTAVQTLSDRFAEGSPTPKHIVTPYMSEDGELIFESISCVYSLVSLFLQYLHVYRTIWWLPHSYTNFALNFHLIDYKVLGFLVVMLVRRLVWSCIKRIVIYLSTKNALPLVLKSCKWIFVSCLAGVQFWLLFRIGLVYPLISLLYLCYPLVVCLALFQFQFAPLFEVVPDYVGPHIHNCNGKGREIRHEISLLKTDFNRRLKRALFHALTAAYYSALVPCLFVQSTTVFDINWATQHFFLVWLGHFTLFAIYVYPPRYCDILHKAALHLGQWTLIDTPSDLKNCVDWNEDMIAQRGTVVRYKGSLYAACGINTAAEPGCTSHVRFNVLFARPALAQCLLLAVQVFLVVLQLVSLLGCSEWQHIISCSILLSLNYYVLYKVVRDYLVLWRVYRAEEMCNNPLVEKLFEN